jgi:BirA family biotin operon repressor/biotin-[acetyl-CoA-carboxylase] ligase
MTGPGPPRAERPGSSLGQRRPAPPGTTLGRPRVHLRATSSTNDRARALGEGGAPHGTLVTAGEQTRGRGRQGRTWIGPPGRALLLSLLLRDYDPLLPLRGGLAVADLAGAAARVKWPNDVLLAGRKVAGILVEARPDEGWAVLGIGLNVAVDPATLPPELRDLAGTLGRSPDALEPTLAELLGVLETRLAQPHAETLYALRARDALFGRPVRWATGAGLGAGIDDEGSLLVRRPDGRLETLSSGEVHLGTSPAG